ncbi:MAG: secretin N-terminal domain-containing protein [Planctomycetota bacterium]
MKQHRNREKVSERVWCPVRSRDWVRGAMLLIALGALGSHAAAQSSRIPTQSGTPNSTLGATTSSEARLRVYDLPTEMVANAIAELTVRYGNDGRVRITTESSSGRLMVMAPEGILSQIDATVEAWRRQAPNVVRDPSTGRVMANVVQSRRYKLQRVTWRELEDAIMRIAGARMTLSTTNNGEIAQLHMLTQEGTRELLQIDRRTDEVRLQGTPQEVMSWNQVVAAIDLATIDPQRPTQIVPITPATPERIEKAISLVRLASFQQPPQDEQTTGNARVGNPQNPQDDNAPGMAVGSPDALSSGTGLIGDVDISFVPEMGLVIVKGGKRDVQRVLEVIEQIKKQSAETQPEIELYPLKHVNGVAIEPVLKDLNDKVFSPRQGQISLYALGQPNVLLLIGRPEALTGIKELIAKLDQPLDPNNQLRVFRLVNSSANDAETIIKNFFNDPGTGTGTTGTTAATPNTQLTTRVKVIADYRTNSLIVQASPRDIAEVARLLLEIDVESTPAENEIRVFPIKNAIASELQPVLQSAITGTSSGTTTNQQGGQPQQTQGTTGSSRVTPPSSRLSFSPRDGVEVNSGILAGVVITTNPSINALVVRAPSKSMPLIASLIDQLDQLPSADARIKVFPVINGDATSLTLTLQQIFGLPATAGASTASAAVIGLQNLAALTGGGESSLVPLRISADTRTNSIIVSGAASDLEVIEVLLYRLDETGGQQRTNEVIWLRNANASDVFTALNNLLTNQRTIITQQLLTGQAISLFERVDREVFVIAEPSTNSLVVSATPRYLQQIRDVIERLDRQQPMIFVEMLIAEVTLDDQFEFGTELGLQDSLLFDRRSASGGTLGSPVFDVLTPAFSSTSPQRRPQNVAGQGSSGFALGRTSELGYGGLVLAASSESVGLLFRMLQDANRAQILARPTLTTIDNNVSVINVGQSIPVLGGTVTNVGAVQQNVEYVNAGLTLQIQPRTNEDGLINMIVAISRATIDRANGLEVANGAVGGGTTLTPAFNQTVAQTRVTAYDGQTVVIGGLISKSRSSTSRRVPWLADIPIAGALFRYDKEVENRTELLVVMTPRVVNFNDASKLDMIKMVESSRMSWCLADVLNIYGDKGLSPGNGLWGPAASPVIYPDESPTVEYESVPSGTSSEGYPMEGQRMLEPIPQEAVEGELFFGDPNSGNVSPNALPNEPTSSRNPRRSLIQGSSYTTPTGNTPPSIDNSTYTPIGTNPNAVAPAGYRPTGTPSTPLLNDPRPSTTIRR